MVRGAVEATLVIAAATDVRHERPLDRAAADAERAAARPSPDLQADHIREHRTLFGRAWLELDDARASEFAALPPDERLRLVRGGGTYLALEALHTAVDRYLQIASSRPGSGAANLQGVRNDAIMPAWNIKCMININLGMNYLPAET